MDFEFSISLYLYTSATSCVTLHVLDSRFMDYSAVKLRY